MTEKNAFEKHVSYIMVAIKFLSESYQGSSQHMRTFCVLKEQCSHQIEKCSLKHFPSKLITNLRSREMLCKGVLSIYIYLSLQIDFTHTWK